MKIWVLLYIKVEACHSRSIDASTMCFIFLWLSKHLNDNMSGKWPLGSDELSIFKLVKDLTTSDQELKFHKEAIWDLLSHHEAENESTDLL